MVVPAAGDVSGPVALELDSYAPSPSKSHSSFLVQVARAPTVIDTSWPARGCAGETDRAGGPGGSVFKLVASRWTVAAPRSSVTRTATASSPLALSGSVAW